LLPPALTLALLGASTLHAQNFAIDWFTIDGGGRTSTGGAPEPVNDNGTNKFILVQPPVGNRFYRLIGPEPAGISDFRFEFSDWGPRYENLKSQI